MTPLRQQLINLLTLKGWSKRTEQSDLERGVVVAAYYHCSPERLTDQELHLLEAGVDLITLKKLLGHAHFATAAGYLHVTVERGAELLDPLASLGPP